jgi:hypothetical protein
VLIDAFAFDFFHSTNTSHNSAVPLAKRCTTGGRRKTEVVAVVEGRKDISKERILERKRE